MEFLPSQSSAMLQLNLSSETTGRCGTGGFCGTASGGGNVNGNANVNANARASMQDGKVVFENQNYHINVNDHGEILIDNKNTGEHYRIWGDPHVDVDGKRAFDFKGDTTFVMDDGTKITIETTPWKGNNGQTISSKVSIIDGNSSFGCKITGVDDHHTGDLTFEATQNFGHFLDATVEDGNYVTENPNGQGFIAVGRDGWVEVDQSVMDFQENVIDQLASGSLNQTSDEDRVQYYKDLLFGDNGEITFASFKDFFDTLTSPETDQPQTTEMDFETLMMKTLFSMMESFMSLATQQAKPMGYFSGLNTIQTQGSFQHHADVSPFTFNLNFYRS